jgi:hypothetical protein
MQPLNQKELIAVAGGNLEAPLVPEVQIKYDIERFTTFFSSTQSSKYNKKVFEFEE